MTLIYNCYFICIFFQTRIVELFNFLISGIVFLFFLNSYLNMKLKSMSSVSILLVAVYTFYPAILRSYSKIAYLHLSTRNFITKLLLFSSFQHALFFLCCILLLAMKLLLQNSSSGKLFYISCTCILIIGFPA